MAEKLVQRRWSRPAMVKQWKVHIYPQIQKRAKKESAVIYFQDESGVRSDFHSGKTWALKGPTPVVESTGTRFGLNMMAAVTPRGKMNFMTVSATVRADQICEFIKRLMHNQEKKVFLIWDGHPTHKAVKVKKCIESFNGRLEVFVLPSYSPDLNPIEQLWSHAKTNGVGRMPVSGPDQLKAIIYSKLRGRQKLPKLIASFFRHPDCAYTIAD